MAFKSAIKGLAKSPGRALTSRGGLIGVGLAAATLGFAGNVGPAARDAAFDIAFDNPDADKAFLGRKLSTRFLLGTAMGGTTGSILRGPFSAPSDYYFQNPVIPGPLNLFGGSSAQVGIGAGVGTGVGTLIGAGIGGKKGALLGGAVGGMLGTSAGLGSVRSAPIAAVGGTLAGTIGGAIFGFKRGFTKGVLGTVGGAIAGGTVGTTLGAGMIAGSIAPTASTAGMYMKNNSNFFQNSPYSSRTSSTMASNLNASGDIVLGMHNSRRGY